MKNKDIGYNQFFEDERQHLKWGNFLIARVISESKGAYKVKNEQGEYRAKVTGKQMFTALSREDYPAVGDWVAIEILDDESAVIQGILPRRTVIKRKKGDRNREGEKETIQIIATNIDFVFVVESVDRDYSLNRIERYFSIAEDGGANAVIILNKIDCITSAEAEEKLSELKNRFPDTDVILTSTVTDDGLNTLRNFIKPGYTYCFLGSSGVGKSSLTNKLLGGDLIKTGAISEYSGRGKHVTTARQMYFLENGGIVIDNPGIREVGMTDTTQGVKDSFDDITDIARDCRFTNCIHLQEPGCAVRAAIERGEISEERYMNYHNLKKEAEFFEMNVAARREKNRKFGKFIHKAKRELRQIDQ